MAYIVVKAYTVNYAHFVDGLFDFYLQENASDSEGQEVLLVRAYGSSFFTLGINIRYYSNPWMYMYVYDFMVLYTFDISAPNAVTFC